MIIYTLGITIIKSIFKCIVKKLYGILYSNNIRTLRKHIKNSKKSRIIHTSNINICLIKSNIIRENK